MVGALLGTRRRWRPVFRTCQLRPVQQDPCGHCHTRLSQRTSHGRPSPSRTSRGRTSLRPLDHALVPHSTTYPSGVCAHTTRSPAVTSPADAKRPPNSLPSNTGASRHWPTAMNHKNRRGPRPTSGPSTHPQSQLRRQEPLESRTDTLIGLRCQNALIEYMPGDIRRQIGQLC